MEAAKDVSEFLTSPKFLAVPLWPEIVDIARRLEDGNDELVAIMGQRGGATTLNAALAAYQIHRLITDQSWTTQLKPTSVFIFFVGRAKGRVRDTLLAYFRNLVETSPWFQQLGAGTWDTGGGITYFVGQHRVVVACSGMRSFPQGRVCAYVGVENVEAYGGFNGPTVDEIRKRMRKSLRTMRWVGIAGKLVYTDTGIQQEHTRKLFAQPPKNVLCVQKATWETYPGFNKEALWTEFKEREARKLFMETYGAGTSELP